MLFQINFIKFLTVTFSAQVLEAKRSCAVVLASTRHQTRCKIYERNKRNRRDFYNYKLTNAFRVDLQQVEAKESSILEKNQQNHNEK